MGATMGQDHQDYRHTQEYMKSLQNQPNGELAAFHYGQHTRVITMTPDQFRGLLQDVKRDINASDSHGL